MSETKMAEDPVSCSECGLRIQHEVKALKNRVVDIYNFTPQICCGWVCRRNV